MDASLVWLIVALGILFMALVVSQSVWSPLRWIGYGLFKIAVGGVLLFVFNSMAGYYDFTIPINPITAAMSGFLGLPGLVSLVFIKAFIV
ncbi:pro-sigmaK processing inhibitor BofA family protein [Ammoniphilus sp. CFH 90114]|uniref:pro-sigmaK processing inhibitor BofA family protein n=1 Tax=Ammoniphilus sp. CFH 90114 TaxID=2493665 RepID=UPI00100E243D|nr:pro-sigmaK processing inhibitor BofA family protein [Ammoniphilus sp. CFH 90114]RXT08979.1 pro-sigmaK processing inhibitor BofA [Ammoniphilus sp. CFH 90114]